MATIYTHWDGGDEADHCYTLSLREAVKAAQESAEANGTPQTVEAQEIARPSVKLILDILNERGWSQNCRVIRTVQPSKAAIRRREGE